MPGIVNGEVSYDQCWTRTTECLKEVLPAAEHAGVRIGIEKTCGTIFLLSPLETARYIDQFDSPAIGAYFDVGNVMAWGVAGAMDRYSRGKDRPHPPKRFQPQTGR